MTIAANRVRAAARFCSCDRCSDALIVSTPLVSRPSSRVSSRARWWSPSAAELPTSQLSSTLLSVVLTDCPPGPDERLNRSTSSPAGMVSPSGRPRPGGR